MLGKWLVSVVGLRSAERRGGELLEYAAKTTVVWAEDSMGRLQQAAKVS